MGFADQHDSDGAATTVRPDQMPVMNHPGETKVVLPPSVSSIDEWGRTMCELPAVAALKKSYLELAEDPTHHDYLMWVISHESKKGARVEDLAKYLKSIKYVEKHGMTKISGAAFPGTNLVRNFKWFTGQFSYEMASAPLPLLQRGVSIGAF